MRTASKHLMLVPAVALCGAVSISTIAAATAPSGASGSIAARGTFPDGLDVKFKVRGHHGVDVASVKGPGQAVIQKITVAAGGDTGWHSHHGPVVVVVMSGAMTLYGGDDAGCTGHTYKAGEAFIDPGQDHVHIARNQGDVPVELWVTFLMPGDDPTLSPRVDEADPGRCVFD